MAVVTRRVVSLHRKDRVSRVEERRERQKRGQILEHAAQQQRQKEQKSIWTALIGSFEFVGYCSYLAAPPRRVISAFSRNMQMLMVFCFHQFIRRRQAGVFVP